MLGGVKVTQSAATATPVATKNPLKCTQLDNKLTCLGLKNGTAYKIVPVQRTASVAGSA